MIKLVVIDLDGTLLNAEHIISEYSKQVIRQVYQTGTQVMLATGRHYQDVYLLAQQLSIPTRLITSNGARVHNSSAKLIYENHIPANLAADILTISGGFQVHRNLYQQDLWLVEEPNKSLLDTHHSSGFSYQITDFKQIDFSHIDKIYFTAPPEVLRTLHEKLHQKFGDQLYITFTTEFFLEVMNKGVSKGQALHKLLKRKDINPDQVMAFGDGLNDTDMLNLVGHPVVMANASDALKKLVPHAQQALSNAEDGVAKYLKQHFLI